MKGKQSGTGARFVGIIVTFIQIIIATDILLQFFGANQTPFVRLVDGLSTPMLRPFAGMFEPVVFDGHLIDLSALFALIVYSVVGFGIQKLFAILKFK